MRLYLDDVRPTPAGFDFRAYTAEEAKHYLMSYPITFVSFDHDLGPAEAGTGYDVAKWIEQQAYERGRPAPDWYVHSANPVGAANIHRAMLSAFRAPGR